MARAESGHGHSPAVAGPAAIIRVLSIQARLLAFAGRRAKTALVAGQSTLGAQFLCGDSDAEVDFSPKSQRRRGGCRFFGLLTTEPNNLVGTYHSQGNASDSHHARGSLWSEMDPENVATQRSGQSFHSSSSQISRGVIPPATK